MHLFRRSRMSDEETLSDISKETANLSLGTEKYPVEGEGKDENEASAAPQTTETAAGKPEDAIISSTMDVPGVVSPEDDLKESCRDMFSKIAKYMEGELSASVDNYTLLETLNNLTTAKYSEMSNMAKTLITSMEELDGKYKSLQPYLDQIDKLEESVASLEQAAYRLDSYSKRLEAKFKKLEKR